jgi:uncharacterized protein
VIDRFGRIPRFRLAAAILAVAALVPPSSAQDTIPDNDGWVTDLAGMLTAEQERAMEALMESYKAGSGHEIALLTVPTLGGLSLERYALQVAREWGIGGEETNEGALLLVAKGERKIRIEVGRGLEGRITDSISGRIIRNVIAPEFKQGRFHEGLRGGIEAMHAAAGGDYGRIPDDRRKRRGSAAAGVFPLLFFLFFLMLARRGARRGGRGGGILPWLILGSMAGGRGGHSSGWHSGGGGGFSGFGGGGGFSGGGASGGW